MARPRGVLSPSGRRARLTRALQRASRVTRFTFADLLAVYAAAYPNDRATHEELSSAIGAMIHDGHLVRAGRRGGLQRYRFEPGAIAPERDTDRLEDAVRDIVAQHYQKETCPISTTAIGAGLRARRLWPDRFPRMSALLERVAREDAADPAAIRRAPTRTVTGERAAFWVPAWAPEQCALEPPTDAEALRRAIDAAAGARPVSAQELRWWIEAQPEQSVARTKLDPRRLGALLRNTADRDRVHVGGAGRVHVLTGPLTCHGGPPERYVLHPPTALEMAACGLEDALIAYRPAEEIASLSQLTESKWADATEADARSAASLSRLRWRLLRAAVAGACPPELLDSAADAVDRAHADAGRWVESAALTYHARYTRRQLLDHAAQELASARRLVATGRRSDFAARRRRPDSRIVGAAALLTMREARAITDAVIAAGEMTAPRPELVYAAARRFPVSPLVRRTTADVTLVRGDELALLDRVDVLLAVCARTALPRLGRLVGTASVHLGHVLRDAGCLARLWAVSPPGPARRALLVAAGLLGPELPLAHAAATATTADDARAVVLAVVLRNLASRPAADEIRRLFARTHGGVRAVARRAASALDAGALLGAAE